MKIAALIFVFTTVSLFGQNVELREKPNATAKNSIFQPISATSTDGIQSIRASGTFQWNITPIIGKMWNGPEKSLMLAVEVVGSNLQPSTAVFVIDGKTFVTQSANWQVDSRGNLVTMLEKEGLVRNLAKAENVSVTVFAPNPLTATFRGNDLAVFRSMVQAFDMNEMHLADGEAIPPSAFQFVHFSEKTTRIKVTVITKEPSTTPYDWEVDGRVSVTCTYSTCNGYYTPPRAGTQQIEGAVLKLLRPDSSIVIARCISKVNILSTVMVGLDAANAGDSNSPTVYRDCRIPTPNTVADAEFHKQKVKLIWKFDGARHSDSETYEIVGILEPVTNH
ncbi:MAG: hypothetical protein P4K83_02200 [Terracidiphilus sp.]|nr:hypothetical protein [Terracidiphilus sp.]